MEKQQLCDATAGIETSAEILYKLEKSNLFIISLDENRQSYRYHHLFADFLRNQLRRYNPEMIPILHNRAARWYEDNGFVKEAAIYCLKGGNLEQAIALTERESVRLLAVGELRKLLDVMTLLSDNIIMSRPRLSTNLAWIKLIKSDIEGAKAYIGYADLR